jgi:hypothetical protein
MISNLCIVNNNAGIRCPYRVNLETHMFIDLATLKSQIDQQISQYSEDSLLAVVQTVGTKDNILKLLDMFESNSQYIAKVAQDSYSHYNGFDKVVLLNSSSPSYKLRLHVWWQSRYHISENAHNHRWNFATKLVKGSYQYEQYVRGEKAGGLFHYQYSSPEGASSYSMRFIDNQSLQPIFKGTISEGSSYVLNHEVIHRVSRLNDEVVATLMLQGPLMKSSTDVYSFEPIPDADELESTPMIPDELLSKLKLLRQLL